MYERDYKITSSLQDAYKVYVRDYGKIDKKQFLAVSYDITKTISDMIIRESLEYRMPGLGYLRIRKAKAKLKIREGKIDVNKNIIDWETTWKYWNEKYPNKSRKEIKLIEGKKVFFQVNRHTDGNVMRWYWDKYFTVKNVTVYSFKTIKGGIFDGVYMGRIGLGKWIKSEDKTNDYYY